MIEHPPPEPKEEIEIVSPRKGMGGRPEHETTEAFKNVVMVLTGLKFSQFRIAQVLKISPTTLKKYYAEELETGEAMLYADVAGAIMGKVREGDTRAMIYVSEKLGVFDVQRRIEAQGESEPDTFVLKVVHMKAPDGGT